MKIRVWNDGSAAIIKEDSPQEANIVRLDGLPNDFTDIEATEDNMNQYFPNLDTTPSDIKI